MVNLEDDARYLNRIRFLIEHPQDRPFPEEIRAWVASSDLQVLGAVYFLLRHTPAGHSMQAMLEFKGVQAFLLRYFQRCFVEDFQAKEGEEEDFSPLGRYEAGGDLLFLLVKMWRDATVPRWAVDEFKTMLAELYRAGDAAIRSCIVAATLEHLCEDDAIAAYFSDWRNDPLLEEAYGKAMKWADWAKRNKREVLRLRGLLP